MAIKVVKNNYQQRSCKSVKGMPFTTRAMALTKKSPFKMIFWWAFFFEKIL